MALFRYALRLRCTSFAFLVLICGGIRSYQLCEYLGEMPGIRIPDRFGNLSDGNDGISRQQLLRNPDAYLAQVRYESATRTLMKNPAQVIGGDIELLGQGADGDVLHVMRRDVCPSVVLRICAGLFFMSVLYSCGMLIQRTRFFCLWTKNVLRASIFTSITIFKLKHLKNPRSTRNACDQRIRNGIERNRSLIKNKSKCFIKSVFKSVFTYFWPKLLNRVHLRCARWKIEQSNIIRYDQFF